MRTSTVLNHEQRLRGLIRDIVSRGRSFHFTYKELNDYFLKVVVGNPAWNRLPRYSRSYLQGYWDALRTDYWKNVIWVHAWNGRVYDKFSEMPEEAKVFHVRNDCGLHIYKDDRTKIFTGKEEYLDVGDKS